MILLDSLCMKLLAVGEGIKNLDKITNKELLLTILQYNGNRLWECVISLFIIISMSMPNKSLIAKRRYPNINQSVEKMKSELKP